MNDKLELIAITADDDAPVVGERFYNLERLTIKKAEDKARRKLELSPGLKRSIYKVKRSKNGIITQSNFHRCYKPTSNPESRISLDEIEPRFSELDAQDSIDAETLDHVLADGAYFVIGGEKYVPRLGEKMNRQTWGSFGTAIKALHEESDAYNQEGDLVGRVYTIDIYNGVVDTYGSVRLIDTLTGRKIS